MFEFLSPVLNFLGGMEQRDSQEAMFQSGQQFNSAEAAIARQFNEAEAAKNREFASGEVDEQRAFNQSEAQVAREFNQAEAGVAREFNASQAQINRDYQERLSNSAYQRAMADMKAANLNPMLAFMKGGAAVPSGSQASAGAASGSGASSGAASGSAASSSPAHGPSAPHLENLMAGAVTSGLQAQQIGANVEKARAETRLIDAQARNEGASPSDNLEDEHGNIRLPSYKVQKIMAEADLSREQKSVIEPTIRKLLNESQHLASSTQVNVHEARLRIAQRLTELVRPGLINAETRHTLAGAVLQELEAPRARNLANVQSSPWMVKVSPYLRDLFTTGASAAAIRSSTR